MTVPTCLYRHRDAAGRCLYLGISSSPAQRLLTHVMGSSPWIMAVRRIDVEWFPSRSAAEIAEAEALASERPPYNTEGTGRARRRALCEGPERLSQWLTACEADGAVFAKQVRSTPVAIRDIAAGRRRPYHNLAARIEEVTQGAVPAASWWSA